MDRRTDRQQCLATDVQTDTQGILPWQVCQGIATVGNKHDIRTKMDGWTDRQTAMFSY